MNGPRVPNSTGHVALRLRPPPSALPQPLKLGLPSFPISICNWYSFPVMLDSMPECELPFPGNTQNVDFANGLERLDMLPLVVGIGAAVVAAILTPILAPVFLSTLGFSAVGPVAGKSEIPTLRPGRGYIKEPKIFRIMLTGIPLPGTAAAAIQAGIGNVLAGSLFATVQSIAMGGAVPAIFTAISAGITGITAAAAVTVGLGSSIHSMGAAAASAVGAGIDAVVNMTAGAVAEYGPGVVSFGEGAASAIGTGIDTVANMTTEVAAEFGPGALSKGEAVASAVGEGIGVVANMTAAAADDLKPSIISIGKAAASAIGAGIGAIVNMTHKDW